MRILRRWVGAFVGFGMIWGCEGGYSPAGGTTQPETTKDATILAVPSSVSDQKERVNITFSSDPDGVEIWIDGVFSGVSPKVLSLEKSEKVVSLEFKKDGYVSATNKLIPNRDTPVIAKLREAQAQAQAPAPKKALAAQAPKPGEPEVAPKTEEEKKDEKKDKIKSLIER